MNRLFLTNPRLARSLGNFAGEWENVMDRFFGDVSEEGAQAVFAPRLDIAETETEYEISVDLPGVKAEDVHVEMHEDRLTISGSRHSTSESGDRQFHRIERSSGSFSRTVTLPATVDHDQIDASYEDGVLLVTLPKAKSHQPRKIQIRGGHQASSARQDNSQDNSRSADNSNGANGMLNDSRGGDQYGGSQNGGQQADNQWNENQQNTDQSQNSSWEGAGHGGG
jgi:HSP20 family protein